MTDVWPSIQIIFEHQELITRCRSVIEKDKEDLKTKPVEALDMITVINSKSREKLEHINIIDRTTTILEIKKALQKKNFLNQLETKCQTLDIAIHRFHSKFNVLNQKGLPILVAPSDKLVIL